MLSSIMCGEYLNLPKDSLTAIAQCLFICHKLPETQQVFHAYKFISSFLAEDNAATLVPVLVGMSILAGEMAIPSHSNGFPIVGRFANMGKWEKLLLWETQPTSKTWSDAINKSLF